MLPKLFKVETKDGILKEFSDRKKAEDFAKRNKAIITPWYLCDPEYAALVGNLNNEDSTTIFGQILRSKCDMTTIYRAPDGKKHKYYMKNPNRPVTESKTHKIIIEVRRISYNKAQENLKNGFNCADFEPY